MKLFAFAASNSKTSINRKLVLYAADRLSSLAEQDVETESIELFDYELPLYRPDREAESGIPELANDFFQKIGSADAVMVSFAEHNGLYTAAYKNLFDWASRIDQKVYQNKPMVLLSTSPGGRGAANVLSIAKESAPHFGMDVKATVSIPSFQDNFDADAGVLTNDELAAEVDQAVKSLIG